MKNKLTYHIKNKIGKYQVIYSEDRKFIWYKNPKTAGTSMFRGIMMEEIDDIMSYKDNSKEFDKWWNSLTDKKINEYFTFTFVRNPYDRLVSAFNHVVIENILRVYIDSWPIIHPNEEITERASGLLFDELFMLFILFCQRGLENWDKDDQSMFSASSHWMPQSYFIEIDGYQHVDFIGKYENLEIDWKYVANKIQVNEKLPFIGASYTAKNNDVSQTREKQQKIHWSHFYLDDSIIEQVTEFYRRDIDILDYHNFEKDLLDRQKSYNKANKQKELYR